MNVIIEKISAHDFHLGFYIDRMLLYPMSDFHFFFCIMSNRVVVRLSKIREIATLIPIKSIVLKTISGSS